MTLQVFSLSGLSPVPLGWDKPLGGFQLGHQARGQGLPGTPPCPLLSLIFTEDAKPPPVPWLPEDLGHVEPWVAAGKGPTREPRRPPPTIPINQCVCVFVGGGGAVAMTSGTNQM